MKKRLKRNKFKWCLASIPGICVAPALWAADPQEPAPAPPLTLSPEQIFEGGTNTYNNWLELSTGGFFTTGSTPQFQQSLQRQRVFGGIEDFHYQGDIKKGTTFSIDGRSIFDSNDYKLRMSVDREKLGYLRLLVSEYRTWYDGDGGFFPPENFYEPLAGDALGLDRQEISIEGGLTLPKKPKVTFKYTHTERNGQKNSTIWGVQNFANGDSPRGLIPSVNDIKEHGDSFQIDATHKIKDTGFGVGLRYDTGKLDNALLINQFRGEPIEQKITDRQGTSYDLFNVHAFTETWLKKNLLFTTGYSFSDLDNTFSGSRIYGNDFDVGYVPNADNGAGYLNLSGGSRMHEYVTDINLLYKPTPHLTITPSIRVQKEDVSGDSSGLATLGDSPATPFASDSNGDSLDVRERLDLQYNGITNWVFYARGELSEGTGNLNETGGIGLISGTGVPGVQRETEDTRFFQKYSIGARWYPDRRVSVDAGAYYKNNDYDYDHTIDSTPNTPDSLNRYPAYLVMQNFKTYDGNLRVTWRPLRNVTMISRYELQYSTINTQPDSISGLDEVETSTMTSHIIGEDISWSPFSRLNFQAGANYVLSDTETPASETTQAILNSQNNYWTLNFSSGLALNAKTDLRLGYFYYNADNYKDNSLQGVPFGIGEQQHGITATLTRRISKNLLWTLKYGFFHYDEATYGGNRDFNAHMIYSSIKYRF